MINSMQNVELEGGFISKALTLIAIYFFKLKFNMILDPLLSYSTNHYKLLTIALGNAKNFCYQCYQDTR